MNWYRKKANNYGNNHDFEEWESIATLSKETLKEIKHASFLADDEELLMNP